MSTTDKWQLSFIGNVMMNFRNLLFFVLPPASAGGVRTINLTSRLQPDFQTPADHAWLKSLAKSG